MQAANCTNCAGQRLIVLNKGGVDAVLGERASVPRLAEKSAGISETTRRDYKNTREVSRFYQNFKIGENFNSDLFKDAVSLCENRQIDNIKFYFDDDYEEWFEKMNAVISSLNSTALVIICNDL